MLSSRLLLLVVFATGCLATGQAKATDEPLTFKGLGWGSSPEQLRKLLAGVPGWTCTSSGVTGIHNCWANGGTYAGVRLDRTQGSFSNSKLVAVRLESSEASARDHFVKALRVKFGDPAETKTKVGGKADNTYTSWGLGGERFVAVACAGPDSCSVSIGLGPLTAGPTPEAVTGAKDL